MPEETGSSTATAAPAERRRYGRSAGILIHWMILFAFWVVLSGMFDAFHLTAGLLCTAGIAVLTRELQLVEHRGSGREDFHLAVVPWHRQLVYAAWLWREIVVANWQVLRIVLDPRLPIDPALIRFQSSLRSDLAKTVLANSITLTPGTITVDVSKNEFLVHALVVGEPAVEGIARMQRAIAAALPGSEIEAEEHI